MTSKTLTFDRRRRFSFLAVRSRRAAESMLQTALRMNGLIRVTQDVPATTDWLQTQLTEAEFAAVLETLEKLDPQSVVISC